MESHRSDRSQRQAERQAQERQRREQEEAKARKTYLADLSQREDRVWNEVETLVLTKNPTKYDQAARLLKDLHDMNVQTQQEKKYFRRYYELCQRHSQKPSFLRRLKNVVPDCQGTILDKTT